MPRIRRQPEPERTDYTPAEVARLGLLHLQKSQVYEYIKRGEIQTFIGESGETRISLEEIRRLLELWKLDPEREPDQLLKQAELRERGRSGGYARASRHSKAELSQLTRNGRHDYWQRTLDPAGTLPPADLERRIAAAENAHMADVRRRGLQRKMLEQQYRHQEPERGGSAQ